MVGPIYVNTAIVLQLLLLWESAFGLFNASFVWGTKTLFERLGGEKPSAVSEKTATGSIGALEKFLLYIKETADDAVDYWLPPFDKDTDLNNNFRRMVGAILFLPLLVMLKSNRVRDGLFNGMGE